MADEKKVTLKELIAKHGEDKIVAAAVAGITRVERREKENILKTKRREFMKSPEFIAFAKKTHPELFADKK